MSNDIGDYSKMEMTEDFVESTAEEVKEKEESDNDLPSTSWRDFITSQDASGITFDDTEVEEEELPANAWELDALDEKAVGHLSFHAQTMLLRRSRSTSHLRDEGYQVTHMAARYGRKELLDWQLMHGEEATLVTSAGKSLGHLAAEYGHVEILESLYRIPQGVPLGAISTTVSTAVHMAASNGHLNTLESLARHGEDLEPRNHDSHTPYMLAAANGHLQIMEYLWPRIALSSESEGLYHYTPLLLATLNAHIPVVRYCLLKGSKLSEMTNLQNNALHIACMSGSVKMVNFLLRNNPDQILSVHNRNLNKQTPLHLAAWAGHTSIVRFLITQHNAPIDAVNAKKNTPFLIACLRGHLDTAKELVRLGASFRDLNLTGNTPLLLAAYGGHNGVIDWLLDPNTASGLDITQRSTSGLDALLQAATGGNLRTVEYLITKYKADPYSTDSAGNSAADLPNTSNNGISEFIHKVWYQQGASH